MMKILIASPDSQLRLALSFLLNTEPRITVLGSISDGAGLAALARGSAPDLILLDDRLFDENEPGSLPHLVVLNPTAQFMILSNDDQLHPGGPVKAVIAKNEFPERLLPLLQNTIEP